MIAVYLQANISNRMRSLVSNLRFERLEKESDAGLNPLYEVQSPLVTT
jgi:hypothetical protein